MLALAAPQLGAIDALTLTQFVAALCMPPALIGVLWLTSQVYGQPTAIELKDEIARFYKMFFRVDLTPTQIADMLEIK